MAKKDFFIIYQDDDILVVDKPAGLLSVPIPKSSAKNLFDLVAQLYAKQGKKIKTVHRIDRYTGGVMVFTKNDKAFNALKKQFRNYEPERVYLALVRGVLEKENGELKHHLMQVKRGFRNIVVHPNTKDATEARLEYKVLEALPTTTLVQVNLKTGLKNQIRVQFNEEGHPLVGDRHYAEAEAKEKHINRQALHAWKLSLKHPATGKKMEFEAKLPNDMQKLIEFYRKSPKRK
jgi:23S rRNA pseudouridine1911/1915/1917 synthase